MVDPASSLPLHEQVRESLRRSIESGEWQPREAIPPERELIERFGVSRITVRQALADLQAAGLVYRVQGKGTFVSPHSNQPIAESLTELTGHLEELQLQGLDPEVEVLQLSVLPIPGEVAESLHRPEGAEGWFMYRLVRVDERPLMLSEVYLPTDLMIPLAPETVKRIGMARLLTDHGHVPVRGTQRIGARSATAEQAHLLNIAEGEAVLRVVRVIYGRGDRPLVWFRTLYRADRYEYEVALKRKG